MTFTNEKFTKETFKFHKDKFHQHLKTVNEIQDYTTIYSNRYLDFHPFYSEMSQLKKATIYKKTPAILDGKFEHKLVNEKAFYSNQMEVNWLSACFYQIKDENQNIIVLQYDGTIKKPELNQIYISIFEEDRLCKILGYHSDKNYIEDSYFYDNQGKVEQIIRNGYWDGSKNINSTQTFKFEYENKDEFKIFCKQLKLNGQNEFELLFPQIKK